jgi:processive 1,2-diacylglycerol beta-glucosyltransferase
MASGLPMAIYDPIPGQEERNSDQLLEKGVAIKCNEISILGYKVDRLLADPERLKGMQAAARKMGRPNAAETVVKTLLSDPEHEAIRVDPEQQEVMAESVRKR